MAAPAAHAAPFRRLSVSLGRAGETLLDTGRVIGRGVMRDLVRRPARRAGTAVPRTDFDPTTPTAIADPYPALQRLRRHPVHVNERLNVWMIARYDDVTAAAKAHETLSSSSGIMLRSGPLPTVLTTDQPDHTRLRRLTAASFTPAAIRRFEGELQQFVTPGIDALVRGDIVDVVRALTAQLPVSAIALLLGIDRPRWKQFRAWSHDITALFAARSLSEMTVLTGRALPAVMAWRELVDDELDRHRGTDRDDILGRIGQALDAGEITRLEARSAALILLIAGNETTTNLLGTMMILLAREPQVYTRLRADRDLLPAAIEEAARWASPVQWVARTTKAPYQVHGTLIPPKSRVVLFYAGANRDPEKFAHPDRYDIDRDSTGHVGFGHGTHFCMGAHLARLEVKVALTQLLDRVQHLELAGPITWTTTPSLSGPTAVPLRATPA